MAAPKCFLDTTRIEDTPTVEAGEKAALGHCLIQRDRCEPGALPLPPPNPKLDE